MACRIIRVPGSTFIAVELSFTLVTESSLIRCVNAGQGDECSYFVWLWKSSLPQFEHTYIPVKGK